MGEKYVSLEEEAVGDDRAQVDALNARARALRETDTAQALLLTRQAYTLAMQVKPARYARGAFASLMNGGYAYLEQGRFDRAHVCFAEARRWAQGWEQNGVETAAAEAGLGRVAADSGEQHEAVRYLEQALAGYREAGQQAALIEVLLPFGRTCRAAGDYERAAAALGEMIDKLDEDVSPTLARAHLELARVYREAGDDDRALQHAQQGGTLAQALGDGALQSEAGNIAGDVYRRQGDAAQALIHFRAAVARAHAAGSEANEAIASLYLAQIYATQGEDNAARHAAAHALALAEQIGDEALLARGYRALADLYRDQGDFAQALRHFRHYHEHERAFERERARLRHSRLLAKHEMERTWRREAEAARAADVVLQARLLEALRAAQDTENLRHVAGTFLHRFNNLFMGMMAQGSLALRRSAAGDEARPHLERAMGAMEEAAGLSKEAAAYLRRGRFAFTVLDLNRLIAEERDLVAAFVPASCRVETELAPSLPAVDGNRGQLRQLLLNLVMNGADALDDTPGVVRIVTDLVSVTADDARYWRYTERPLKAGDYLRLRVVDGGRGMTAETLAQLCTPFYTTKQAGEGLGLAAVRNIVRDHRGGLAVDSTPGEGTTVAILLPPADQGTPRPATAARPRSARGATVLLIDDEPEVRLALEAMLQVEGFSVIVAASGSAGLAQFAAAAGAIGLVLLDLSMPEMDGEETLRRLRALDATVPVIVMSGYGEEKVMARFQAFDAIRFLQKPFTLTSLQRVLQG